MQTLQSALAGQSEYREISSLYGHDAFLKEIDSIGAILADHLAEGY
jgi:homoserine acetyltransferase